VVDSQPFVGSWDGSWDSSWDVRMSSTEAGSCAPPAREGGRVWNGVNQVPLADAAVFKATVVGCNGLQRKTTPADAARRGKRGLLGARDNRRCLGARDNRARGAGVAVGL